MKPTIEVGFVIFLSLCFVSFAEETCDKDGKCDNDGTKSRVVELSATPSVYTEPDVPTLKATFGMGCFWGVEAAFGAQPGVIRVKAGYTGGTKVNPTYRDLVDHTEAVEIEYNPSQTNYENLLDIFWENHDFKAKFKTQYKSAIFYHDDDQKRLAEETKVGNIKKDQTPVTDILAATTFYDAEDYHQKYFLRSHKQLVEELGLKDADFLSSSRTSRLLGYIAGPGEQESFDSEYRSLGLSDAQAEYIRNVMAEKVFEGCAP